MTEEFNQEQHKPRPQTSYPGVILLFALIIAIIFDRLIWDQQLGLQVLIMVVIIIIAMLVLVALDHKRIPKQSFVLHVPILIFAGMTAFRRETSTTLVNILLVLVSGVFLSLTMLNGQWMRYRMREVFFGTLQLVASTIADPVLTLIRAVRSQAQLPAGEKFPLIKKLWPFILGVLIALPLLLLLGVLLASADLIFRERLSDLFGWVQFGNLFELFFRMTYVIIFAYALSGIFIHVLSRSIEKKQVEPDKPIIRPFLGHIEAITILTLINLLFLGFIIIQFRYFFAGEANITLEAFTYAEYARRGFFELVAVALISLGLYYLLSMVTKRPGKAQARVFSGLGILLIIQVSCMLVSAFQRLSLYEAAYGFTTMRTITHIFMIWLGALLVAAVLMETLNQFKHLALLLFLVFIGFTTTLNLLNVDRFIARRNIDHALKGNDFDASYLIHQLSQDGDPVLFESWLSADTSPMMKDALYGTLACRNALRNTRQTSSSWVSWHFSTARSDSLFSQHQAQLDAYPFIEVIQTFTYLDENNQETQDSYVDFFIEVNGQEVWCLSDLLRGE